MLATYRSLQLQTYDAVLSGYCSQWASLREDYLRLREEAKLMTRKRLISAFEAQSGFNLLIMSPLWVELLSLRASDRLALLGCPCNRPRRRYRHKPELLPGAGLLFQAVTASEEEKSVYKPPWPIQAQLSSAG
ncbi:hypothetical protein E5198_01055 [Pseudomonas sp. A-1]|uniref:hypothetical protein n=1 Tax=Pseudomonas sp. A-1 TaxID=1821274 RepID=UPI0010A641EA|nr:hypothetical protein [Pseudomonas sp. A-1]THG87130.1 hypothetical protein E5198_01055 [Pseudomonas sp. A-1]